MNYAGRFHKDANHKSIVIELRKQGVDVVEILQPLDLLARFGSVTGFIEIKMPGSRARWTRQQLQFIADSGKWPVCIATDAAQAMKFLKTGKGLTQKQKDALAAFLLRQPKSEKFFTPNEIEKVLAI